MFKLPLYAAVFMLAMLSGVASAAAPPLELVVLGSGGPGATGRAGAGYAVLVDGEPRIFVDAGPGTFVRLGEAKLSLAHADIVLLTHLHIDHTADLPALFKARAISSRGPISFQVFGPSGRQGSGEDATFPSTSRFVDLLFGKAGAFSYLRDFSAPITLKVTDIDASEHAGSSPQVLVSEHGLRITAIAGHHGDAPAVIYRIDYANQSMTFSGDIDAKGLANLRRMATHTRLLVLNSVVLDPPGSPPVLLYPAHPAAGDWRVGRRKRGRQTAAQSFVAIHRSATRCCRDVYSQALPGARRFCRRRHATATLKGSNL